MEKLPPPSLITSDIDIDVMKFPLPEEMIKLIECPICNEIPIGPIWLCTTGHSTCNICRRKMDSCGLCRMKFTTARNYTVESILLGSIIVCPYKNFGCNQVLTGEEMKQHIDSCEFGPKIKWVQFTKTCFPSDAVRGGTENGIPLYIIRAHYSGSIIPGKLYEPVMNAHYPEPTGIISWNGIIHRSNEFEVLTAPVNSCKWIVSQYGEHVPNAIPGGVSETGEQLYIGRVKLGPNVINGKIQPSHGNCYVGTIMEVAFPSYYILVSSD